MIYITESAASLEDEAKGIEGNWALSWFRFDGAGEWWIYAVRLDTAEEDIEPLSELSHGP